MLNPLLPCDYAQGFGWAIAKALAEAGAEISLGVWVSLPCPQHPAYSRLLHRYKPLPAYNSHYEHPRSLHSGACAA
jgi:hypothetical protein